MRHVRAIAVGLLSPVLLVTTLNSDTNAQTSVQRYDQVAPVPVEPVPIRSGPMRRLVQTQRVPTRTGRVRGSQNRTNQDRLRPTQTRTTPSRGDPERTSIIQDQIPESALLTERGIQLANRLRILRISEARMGKKHPSYETVQNEINDIKRELTAWSADEDWVAADGDESVIEKLPLMNERDLKQLVIQLVGKIGQLEDRVARLEKLHESE